MLDCWKPSDMEDNLYSDMYFREDFMKRVNNLSPDDEPVPSLRHRATSSMSCSGNVHPCETSLWLS
jgi:hypothetical protein